MCAALCSEQQQYQWTHHLKFKDGIIDLIHSLVHFQYYLTPTHSRRTKYIIEFWIVQVRYYSISAQAFQLWWILFLQELLHIFEVLFRHDSSITKSNSGNTIGKNVTIIIILYYLLNNSPPEGIHLEFRILTFDSWIQSCIKKEWVRVWTSPGHAWSGLWSILHCQRTIEDISTI